MPGEELEEGRKRLPALEHVRAVPGLASPWSPPKSCA